MVKKISILSLIFSLFSPLFSFAQCNDLFFSEYIEGSSSNKALEIYNPTNATVNLSDYVIYRNNNGSITPSDSLFPQGTLDSGDVYVISNPSATLLGITSNSDTTHTMTFYNGDDAVYLVNTVTNDTLDIIGVIGIDPGAGWPVGTGATNNFTLVRNITVTGGQTNWAIGSTEWDVFPIDMDDSTGGHNANVCSYALSITVDSDESCGGLADGGATAVVSSGIPPLTFAWSNSATTATIASLNAGTYTVTVTDGTTATLVDSVVIALLDTINPIALAQNTTFYLDMNGLATITAMDLDAGSTDNCSITNMTVDSSNFDCNNLGTTLVTFKVEDGAGNSDSLVVGVTILDTIAPIVVSKTDTVYLDSSGQGTLDPANLDNGSTDNCSSVLTFSADSLNFNLSHIGLNTVNFSVADLSGNVATVLANVLVKSTFGIPRDTLTEIGCGSYTWSQNGVNYTMSGFYGDTLLDTNGIDSAYYFLDLTINNAVTGIDTITACDSITWIDGNTYTSSNNFATFTLVGSNTCDSIVTLNLTINNSSMSSTETINVCNEYTWSETGLTYTSTGIYSISYPNSIGCDSVLILDLTIDNVNVSVVNTGDSIFAVQTGGSYQWIDCDNGNLAISGADKRGFKPDTTGNFAVIVGNGLCVDTSSCNLVRFVGIDNINADFYDFNMYPNPTESKLFIQTNNFTQNRIIQIFDISGSLVLETKAIHKTEEIDLSGLEAGMYFVRFQNKMKKVIISR